MATKKADATSSKVPPPLKRPHHHKPFQFVILSLNIVIALSCLGGAVALVYGQSILNDTKKTAAFTDTPTTVPQTTTPESGPPQTGDSTGASIDTTLTTGDATTVPASFPIADPNAKNFLITGADSHACDDEGTNNPVGDRGGLGERSDTIMIMRVDPSTSRAAVLSFPRDLWVKISGTNGSNKINAAYKQDDPQRLRDTIYLNFFIPVDHYIQIDFCAFKKLVDAVGGVAVPFEYPARDSHTNLNVPEAGCYTFDGAGALAYVRSRHYMYLDPKTGKYKEDPLSDYGRISRQQDFLRRAVAKIINNGFDLDVAGALIDVAKNYVVTDPDLTVGKQLEFAGVLKSLNPNDIQTYQIEGVGATIAGQSAIRPKLDGKNMKAILAIFRGEAQLATAPDQVFDPAATTTTTTTTPAATTTTPSGTTTTVKAGTPTTTTTPPTTTTLPPTEATEIVKGVVPPKDVTC